MVTRLFPLGVNFSFEDRVYRLGETINLAVELSPRRDMEVREGRVDLVCEEQWSDVGTVRQGGARGMMVQKQVVEHRRESYLHSRVVFLQEAQLRSGATARHNARLEIGTEPPPHVEKATSISWRLVTTVDVAGARDIKARRSVKIAH